MSEVTEYTRIPSHCSWQVPLLPPRCCMFGIPQAKSRTYFLYTVPLPPPTPPSVILSISLALNICYTLAMTRFTLVWSSQLCVSVYVTSLEYQLICRKALCPFSFPISTNYSSEQPEGHPLFFPLLHPPSLVQP